MNRVYDYLFGPRFQRRREAVVRGLEAFAQNQGGEVLWDSESTLFPKIMVEGPRSRVRLVVNPNLRKVDYCDVQLAIYSTRIASPNYFPVVEVFSKNLLSDLFPAPWMEMGVVAEHAFDHHFRIRFLPPVRLNVFLGGKERDLLFRLLYLYKRHNLHLSTEFDKVVLRKTLHIDDIVNPDSFHLMWKRTIALFRRLEQKVTEVILGEDEMRVVAIRHDMLARCKVCGESILFDEVRCDTCDTPHHHDCWSYGGGCSVYGCGSRNYRIRRAPSLQDRRGDSQ